MVKEQPATTQSPSPLRAHHLLFCFFSFEFLLFPPSLLSFSLSLFRLFPLFDTLPSVLLLPLPLAEVPDQCTLLPSPILAAATTAASSSTTATTRA